MSIYRNFVDRVENLVSRSRVGLNTAFRLRKFANAVIYNSMYPERNIHIESDMFYNGEIEFLKVVAPQIKSFIDVGANIGDWTARLLSIADNDVTGFLYEPSGGAMEKLESRYGQDRRLVLSQSAVGEKCGMTTFYEEPNAGQTSSVVKGVSNGQASQVQIPLTTLEKEFEKHQLSDVDMVKIDAEGYDGHILKGAKKMIEEQRIGIIQFEYNTFWLKARSTLAEALNLLEGAGYTTYQLTKEKICAYDYEKLNEYFNYGIFIAVGPGRQMIGPCKFQG